MGVLHRERYNRIIDNLVTRSLLSLHICLYGWKERYVDLCSKYPQLATILLESIAEDLSSDEAKLSGWVAGGRLLDGGRIKVQFYEKELWASVIMWGEDGKCKRHARIDLNAENSAPNFVFIQEITDKGVLSWYDNVVARSF
mgnify:FL=1|jgi:hypothetical protein